MPNPTAGQGAGESSALCKNKKCAGAAIILVVPESNPVLVDPPILSFNRQGGPSLCMLAGMVLRKECHFSFFFSYLECSKARYEIHDNLLLN